MKKFSAYLVLMSFFLSACSTTNQIGSVKENGFEIEQSKEEPDDSFSALLAVSLLMGMGVFLATVGGVPVIDNR